MQRLNVNLLAAYLRGGDPRVVEHIATTASNRLAKLKVEVGGARPFRGRSVGTQVNERAVVNWIAHVDNSEEHKANVVLLRRIVATAKRRLG